MFATVFEKRSSLTATDDFWYGIAGVPTSSGKAVNKKTAMKLWAVYACVSLISETLACLPLKVKSRRKDGGTEDATELPLYDILKLTPNPDMTSFTWRETSQGGLLCNGNSYSFIQRKGKEIVALWPIESSLVQPVKKDGRFFYIVNEGAGKRKIVESSDMLHIVGFGFNGLIGESVITNFAKETIGNGLALDEFQGKFFKNGIHTSGTLEHPETLGDNKDNFINALRNRYQGGANIGVPMVLESGMTFKQHKISLVDQQFIEQMEATALQICGIFKVPPSKIGIYGKGTSYNNTEQQGKNFLDTTMLQWLVRWEQAMNVKLLTKTERLAGYFIKYNFDGLLRPDAKTRAEIAQKEWQQGVPLNVIRQRNDENPVPGGDIGYVPLNFVPAISAGTGGDRDACGCGVEHRVEPAKKESREIAERSIAGRDRVSRAWSPVIKRAASKLVTREAIAISREAIKQSKKRSSKSFAKWIDEYYLKFSDIIIDEIGPAIRGYQDQMATAISAEIGQEVKADEIELLSVDYVDGLSRKWVDGSKGQLILLLDGITDDYAPILERTEEWKEKKADKVLRQQLTSAAGAVAVSVFSSAGMSYVWTVRGSENCPYCESLDGLKMSDGGTFVRGGTELSPDGAEPFKVRNNVMYPSIHRGCDCYLRAV